MAMKPKVTGAKTPTTAKLPVKKPPTSRIAPHTATKAYGAKTYDAKAYAHLRAN